MSTNDSDAARSVLTQQPGSGMGPANMDLSRQPGTGADSTGTKHVQSTGVYTGACGSDFTGIFRTAGLSQAHDVLRGETAYLMCLPTDHLWDSYSVDDNFLAQVKLHLVETGWLSEQGKWNGPDGQKIDREKFIAWGTDGSGIGTFAFFSHLFNAVLGYLQNSGRQTSVEEMIYPGSTEPEFPSVRCCRPDAFLRMVTKAFPTTGDFKWRDITCPFEYRFSNGDVVDSDTRALWSLHHIMRSDARRMFSFGSTVQGTMFRIWLLCRAAPFTFVPFDWFEDPESLLKFFVILATSSEADLGFNPDIERVGESDFDLKFVIQERVYRTSTLLSGIGADAPTGHGTRVFKVREEGEEGVCVIKDCWVEDRPGKQMEHEIVAGIKNDMGGHQFREYFIDVCGHRRMDMSGGFNSVCEVLKNRTFVPKNNFGPQFLIPASSKDGPIYSFPTEVAIADQDNRLLPTHKKQATQNPPHPRFHYQVVYSEEGKSLFDVSSFAEVFSHICRAAEGLHRLHKAGWVHRDPSPGNIIVVGKEAKISDLEFAKRRVAEQLKGLTQPGDGSFATARNMPTGTPDFTAIEIECGSYLFLPPRKSKNLRTKRILLHNPLHDYESIWWITVWFIFFSKPKGVPDRVMKNARDMVYKNRGLTFACGGIEDACALLPEALRPLGIVLVEMGEILAEAYRSFEESFDGSRMLDVFPELKDCLQKLAVCAKDSDVIPLVLRRNLNSEEVEPFDPDVLEGERDQQDQPATEREGGTGGQLIDIDDPSVGVQEEGVVLGKRSGADSSPKVDRAPKREKFGDEPTV